MKKKILITEDDISLCMGIKMALESQEYSVMQASTLTQANEILKQNSIDLIILDVNLPDGNGIEFLREMRRNSQIPVIILTANDLETDIVTGLEIGANDYITKPFSLMILRARVNAQFRNTMKMTDIYIGNYNFNFDSMIFTVNEKQIELSKTEQKLLKILIENMGNTIPRELLID